MSGVCFDESKSSRLVLGRLLGQRANLAASGGLNLNQVTRLDRMATPGSPRPTPNSAISLRRIEARCNRFYMRFEARPPGTNIDCLPQLKRPLRFVRRQNSGDQTGERPICLYDAASLNLMACHGLRKTDTWVSGASCDLLHLLWAHTRGSLRGDLLWDRT